MPRLSFSFVKRANQVRVAIFTSVLLQINVATGRDNSGWGRPGRARCQKHSRKPYLHRPENSARASAAQACFLCTEVLEVAPCPLLVAIVPLEEMAAQVWFVHTTVMVKMIARNHLRRRSLKSVCSVCSAVLKLALSCLPLCTEMHRPGS